jgi:hypothetical protein
MVDGDGTYPAPEVHRLIEPILTDEADIVIGSRLHRDANSQFKKRNRLGNRFFLYVFNYTLGASITTCFPVTAPSTGPSSRRAIIWRRLRDRDGIDYQGVESRLSHR